MLEDVIRRYGGVAVDALTVYTDIFRLGENEIQRNGEQPGNFKGNPLGYKKQNGAAKGTYRVMFDDTFANTLMELQEADFAILNGITYFGRKNVQEHASKMYALIIDLDGVTDETLDNFFFSAAINEDMGIYPLPNYTVLSGTGVHLYYVLEEPMPLYPNIKLQMKELKFALTKKIWNKYTTLQHEKIQYQGINQGFRVIGGKTKISGIRVRAFRTNSHPFSIEKLNEYVPMENRVDASKLWKESKITLAAAQKKYPEWYERRVVNKEPKGTWTCKTDLYFWWLRKIRESAAYGHRYFCIMCLAIYGVKSGVSKEQVEHDAMELLPFLDGLNVLEPFTEEDVRSALECWDERYKTFPLKDISRLSAIPVRKNKRNGRSRKQHLKLVNAMNQVKREMGEPIGRPSAEEVVLEWQRRNPGGRKADCIRETGLSKPTVYKWFQD